MQVSLQALKAFESAARLGSFKLAAEELSITSTAISHHVINLESRLNVALFYRQTRKVTLTEPGKRLAEATSSGFRTIDSALDDIRQVGHRVRVTTTSSLAALIVIPALGAFSQRYPNIAVDVSTGETLDHHLFNLPIRFGNTISVAPSDIIKEEAFDMFGLYGRPLSSYLDKPITVYTTAWKNESLQEPPLEKWLKVNALDRVKIDIETYDQELFGIQAALAGKGLVFCSTTLTQKLVDSRLLQGYEMKAVDSGLCYYSPDKDRNIDRNKRLFLNWFAELIQAQ